MSTRSAARKVRRAARNASSPVRRRVSGDARELALERRGTSLGRWSRARPSAYCRTQHAGLRGSRGPSRADLVAMAARSWLCRDDMDRERLLDMERRLGPGAHEVDRLIARRAARVRALARLVDAPPAALVAGVVFQVAERRTPRSAAARVPAVRRVDVSEVAIAGGGGPHRRPRGADALLARDPRGHPERALLGRAACGLGLPSRWRSCCAVAFGTDAGRGRWTTRCCVLAPRRADRLPPRSSPPR